MNIKVKDRVSFKFRGEIYTGRVVAIDRTRHGWDILVQLRVSKIHISEKDIVEVFPYEQ